MADSSALITIENAVSGYLLRNRRGTEDYITYLENACELLKDYMVHDSRDARSEKVAVNALGIVELPSDCIRVKDPCVAKNGEWWPMTERKDMVNTTTFTGLIEGQDTAFGEGVALQDNMTEGYGARGAVNQYYYTVDMKQRRIYCDGIKSDTILLRYVSSGISITGTTYIPSILILMLDKYLFYKESFWDGSRPSEADYREQSFKKERLKVRNFLNSLTYSQWQDLMWGSFMQAPKR